MAELEHKTTQCHWIDGEEADLGVLGNGTSSKYVIASDSDSDAGDGSSLVSFGVRTYMSALGNNYRQSGCTWGCLLYRPKDGREGIHVRSKRHYSMKMF